MQVPSSNAVMPGRIAAMQDRSIRLAMPVHRCVEMRVQSQMPERFLRPMPHRPMQRPLDPMTSISTRPTHSSAEPPVQLAVL